jgi:hypothetical protein
VALLTNTPNTQSNGFQDTDYGATVTPWGGKQTRWVLWLPSWLPGGSFQVMAHGGSSDLLELSWDSGHQGGWRLRDRASRQNHTDRTLEMHTGSPQSSVQHWSEHGCEQTIQLRNEPPKRLKGTIPELPWVWEQVLIPPTTEHFVIHSASSQRCTASLLGQN